MRGTVMGLSSPLPFGTQLPAVYQEDDFTMRLTRSFDELLAPVISAIDCVDAYLTPATAPDDFLAWLATWVGMVVDDDWPEHRRRELVSRAVDLFRMRGTVTGLRDHIRVVTAGEVDVVDNGGVAWSQTPGADLPGEDTPRLAVRVTVADPSIIHVSSLEALLTAGKPAHVVHRLEVSGQ